MRRRIYWLWSGQWRKGGVSATYLDNIPEGWERLALKSIFCIFIFLLCIMKMKQSAFLLVQSPFHVHPLSAEKCVFKHVTSRGRQQRYVLCRWRCGRLSVLVIPLVPGCWPCSCSGSDGSSMGGELGPGGHRACPCVLGQSAWLWGVGISGGFSKSTLLYAAAEQVCSRLHCLAWEGGVAQQHVNASGFWKLLLLHLGVQSPSSPGCFASLWAKSVYIQCRALLWASV